MSTLTETFTDIANAIRTKNGATTTYTPAEMSDAIEAIAPKLQSKSATPSETAQTISPDSSYEGLSSVSVGAISNTYVGSGIARKSSTDLTTSGAIVTAPAGYYAEAASKSVTTATQATPTVTINKTTGVVTGSATQTAGYVAAGTKSGTLNLTTVNGSTITPTESEQTAVAADRYTLGAVKIGAISSTYIGSGIDTDPTPTVSGAVVTIPTGYYSEDTTKSVATTTHPDPTVSINTTTGLITASHAQTAGYVSAGTTTKTSQLTTKAAATITPTESEQTAVNANVYTLGAVKVGAISSTYVGSGITQRDSDDLTASGATVTVPAGYYSAQATKSVTTMSLPTSASASATSGYTSKATISRSTSDQYINIPTGYNTAGAYYKINAVANGSVTAPSSISGSSATVSTGTNTLTLTKTVSVTPNVTTAGYISSGTAGNSSVSLTASINTRSSSDLTANGATITAPAGYYAEAATKSVTSGSATGPTSLSGSSASVSTGTNTLTLTKTGVTTTPTVSAGYVSSATASTATVTLTASVTTKAAATITPGTTNQTIASGTYLTGTQTISGDADLTAANIKQGVQIFNVTGTYTSDATAAADDIVSGETAYVNGSKITGSLVINNYYTGSTAPSASLGSNGDIYIQE